MSGRTIKRSALPALLLGVAAALLLGGCAEPEATATGPNIDTEEAGQGAQAEPARLELPRGGTEVFPEYRLVGYSGIKADSGFAFGRLTGDLNARCRELKKIGKNYDKDRKILPVFEFIPVLVHGTPGADGKYRSRAPFSEVKEYLRAARRCKALLLLNIQPGRSEFMPELKYYEKFLAEPDVGVALDPEWAMDPGEVPGKALGRTTGAELNTAAKYLAGLVRENELPQKVMVFHQFNLGAVEQLNGLKPHKEIAIVRSVDGLGGPHIKREEYDLLATDLPDHIHPGFKLFYTEDVHSPWGSRLMTPAEVMGLKPRPEYVLYE